MQAARSPNIDVLHLIILVEARPVLWDKTLDVYKDKKMTKQAWTEICEELDNEFEFMSDQEKNEFSRDVTKKWWNIRDCYVRACKRQKEGPRVGSETSRIRQYVYSDQLQFLNKLKVKQEQQIDDDGSDHNNMTYEDASESPYQDEQNEYTAPFRKLQLISRKRKLDSLDMKMTDEPENRHLSFFRGIIPSLDTFSEDDVIQFQIGVLQLISNIRKQHERADSE